MRRARSNQLVSAFDRLVPAEAKHPELVFRSECQCSSDRPDWKYDFGIGGCTCKARDQIVELGGGKRLLWCRAHMAMRSHRLFATHAGGFEWRGLCAKRNWKVRMWNFTLEPKVVHDRLLIKVTGFRELELSEIIGGLEGLNWMATCAHLSCSKRLQQIVDEAVLTFTGNGCQLEYQSPLYRCTRCPTELRLFIQFEPRITEPEQARNNSESKSRCPYRLLTTTYTDFGACRSTLEREW